MAAECRSRNCTGAYDYKMVGAGVTSKLPEAKVLV